MFNGSLFMLLHGLSETMTQTRVLPDCVCCVLCCPTNGFARFVVGAMPKPGSGSGGFVKTFIEM